MRIKNAALQLKKAWGFLPHAFVLMHFISYFLIRPHIVSFRFEPAGTRTFKKTRSPGGGPTWIRTRDRPVMSRWLCQLSYGPVNPSKPACKSHLLVSRQNPFVKLRMPIPPAADHEDSIKYLSFRLRVGWRSFRRALASICRIRSRVTAKSLPTSSSV